MSHGVRVGIRVSDPAALDLLRDRLPPRWRTTAAGYVDRLYSLILGGADPRRPGVRRFHIAYAGARRLCRSTDLTQVLDAFESDLHFSIAERAPRAVFVHAGVVEWRGRAIVIPGPTRSGKSTLIAALLEAGARYCSDEYAVLDGGGHVLPYPKALSIRREGLPPLRRQPVELGATTARARLPIGCVVVTRFVPGRDWSPRRVSRATAALALLANTVSVRKHPRMALAALARAVASASGFEGERGEARAAARAILAASEPCVLDERAGASA